MKLMLEQLQGTKSQRQCQKQQQQQQNNKISHRKETVGFTSTETIKAY